MIHDITGDEVTTSGRLAGETRWPFCARLTWGNAIRSRCRSPAAESS